MCVYVIFEFAKWCAPFDSAGAGSLEERERDIACGAIMKRELCGAIMKREQERWNGLLSALLQKGVYEHCLTTSFPLHYPHAPDLRYPKQIKYVISRVRFATLP